MWQRLRNSIRSARSYQDMSPDLSVRRQINQQLRQQRPALALTAWCRQYGYHSQEQRRLLIFLYRCLQRYSGLDFSRVRPSDRLVEDLQFPLVCWFDWSMRLCTEILQQFDVDISDDFCEADYETVGELLAFVESRLSPVRI